MDWNLPTFETSTGGSNAPEAGPIALTAARAALAVTERAFKPSPRQRTGMTHEVHLSRVEGELRERSFPTSRETLADECAGTTVLFADGDADLGDLLAEIDQPRFESAEDAFTALQNVLPVEAVGEPGQSDGDA